MWGREGIDSHLPTSKGPFLPGCMDVMTKYSEVGIFVRMFYPTEITGNIKRYLIAGNIYIPTLYGEKIDARQKLKPIIFSHGLGGNRFLYSVICNELASRGYLVVVVEHRDESACSTYYYTSEEDAREDSRTYIEFKKIGLGKGHYKKRNKQIHKRSQDCEKVLNFILEVNSGKVPINVLDDVLVDKEINFKLDDLVDRIDVNNITVCGHSFGAATALLTMSKRKEIKQGILLDPWMFPLKDEKEVVNITQPLIFINTYTFHIQSNVKAMEKYLNGAEREMYTILSTTHENQSDTVFVYGYWLNWFMGKLDPEIAININNCLMLKFLKSHAPTSVEIEDCEKYLKEQKDNYVEGLTEPWA